MPESEIKHEGSSNSPTLHANFESPHCPVLFFNANYGLQTTLESGTIDKINLLFSVVPHFSEHALNDSNQSMRE
jgi:hypothetical protein